MVAPVFNPQRIELLSEPAIFIKVTPKSQYIDYSSPSEIYRCWLSHVILWTGHPGTTVYQKDNSVDSFSLETSSSHQIPDNLSSEMGSMTYC